HEPDAEHGQLDAGEVGGPPGDAGELLARDRRRRRPVEHEVLDLEQVEQELSALVERMRLELREPRPRTLGLDAPPRGAAPGERGGPPGDAGELLARDRRRRRPVEHEVLDLEQVEQELSALVERMRLELREPRPRTLGLDAPPRGAEPGERAKDSPLHELMLA